MTDNDKVWEKLKPQLEEEYAAFVSDRAPHLHDWHLQQQCVGHFTAWFYERQVRREILGLVDWTVQCDPVNNPPEVQRLGELHVDMLVAIRIPFNELSRYHLHLPKKE